MNKNANFKSQLGHQLGVSRQARLTAPKPWRRRVARFFAAGLLATGGVLSASAQFVTQTFSLHSGWNSLWLEVQPTNPAVSVVFAGAPLSSVWTFATRRSAVEFIENPNEPVWNRDRWLRYVPTNHPAAFQNSLFALPPKRAYLVQLTNAFTLNITGQPVWRSTPWVPDAYNLRGFPVDPAARPTFQNFFRYSSAHYDASAKQLRKIYRLSATGQWTAVAPGDLIDYGEAYWVSTRGGSDFVAPLTLDLDAGEILNFGLGLATAHLKLKNLRDQPATVAVIDRTAFSPLSWQQFDGTNNVWLNLTIPATNSVSAAGEIRLNFAVRRKILAADYSSVIEVNDGQGTRLQVAAAARVQSANKTGTSAKRSNSKQTTTNSPFAGLWMGNVAISAVNEVNNATNNVTPTSTSSPFNLRLLLHVDGNGVVRLLKEVTELWQDGTTTNNADGRAVLATPGHYVLVTEDSLFSQFGGSTLKDGTPIGRRVSAIGYDFPTSPGVNYLSLDGSFDTDGALNGTLTGDILLTPQFSTNPFRHKYHPDHDNLDDTFANYKAEAYEVRRSLSLKFSEFPPPGVNAPDYGYRVVAGTYLETLTGLNRVPIICQGTFQLNRIAEIGVLNQ